MRCPKCNKLISDELTVCPHCHKVLALKCPNCGTINTQSNCEKCGYILLTKCTKCGRTNSTNTLKCKCGFPIQSSIAFNECETDEFASLTIQFSALKKLKKILKTEELYNKFYIKLKNILTTQFSNIEGKIIQYQDEFVINLNKELSLVTSADKAIRIAIKIINTFTELNTNVIEQFNTPLNLTITISQKLSNMLLARNTVNNDVKMLTVKKNTPKYLKGMQLIIDQYIMDCISKSYKTDSLYSIEQDGLNIMFYEVVLDSYVLPPTPKNNDKPNDIPINEVTKRKDTIEEKKDIYDFHVFDIKAKCKFEKTNAISLLENIKDNKIISIRSTKELNVRTSNLVKYYRAKGLNPIVATCTEELAYKPWGVLEEIFKEYYKLSEHKNFNQFNDNINSRLKHIIDLINDKPRKAATSEDARFAFIEDFGLFLNSIKNSIIIIEDFELIDDTTVQTLELLFDNFKNIQTRFLFITNKENAVHAKIKGLLRTNLYTEYFLEESNIDQLLSITKVDAKDFINSFYFNKIKENFEGSYIYYKNAYEYLFDKNILVEFDNKLIIQSNASIILSNNISGLLKSRLKNLSKDMDASMILAYSIYIGPRLDLSIIKQLGIKDISKAINILEQSGLAYVNNEAIHINNYSLIKPVIENSIKPQVNEFLAKNLLANIGQGLDNTRTLLIMGKLSLFKEEYLLLWKNSQFALEVGDYDAYLKNCLGFLSLIEHIQNNISKEDINEHKKVVYQNILMYLYNYSPEKIYDIENLLLIDAINVNDNDKIVKLSNLMLQGALISSRYTEAMTLLHNIYARMDNPTLIIDGKINTKFLLLSLINIEILFNIGDFEQCIEISGQLLNTITPENIDQIKPVSFSTKFFVNHLIETFRLTAFAKLFRQDEDILDFFDQVKASTNMDIEDKNSIIAIKDFLSGKNFATTNVENATPFSKIIYLILQEFRDDSDAYKEFAQNIYQAKLLAIDINQTQLELLCDLLIAYSYANMGILQKAEFIYKDVIQKSEKSAIFNILTLAKYFLAKLCILKSNTDEALMIINDGLALIQKFGNQSKIILALFEKLLIDTIKINHIDTIDIETEENKLIQLTENGKLGRLL